MRLKGYSPWIPPRLAAEIAGPRLITSNPRALRPVAKDHPGAFPTIHPGLQRKPSVARTRMSVSSASKAEWPAVAAISSFDSGQALCRSQAFCTGQTTS